MNSERDNPDEAITKADRITPHDEPRQKYHAPSEPTPGIVDPRHIHPGPEILNPPTPGLEPPPESEEEK